LEKLNYQLKNRRPLLLLLTIQKEKEKELKRLKFNRQKVHQEPLQIKHLAH